MPRRRVEHRTSETGEELKRCSTCDAWSPICGFSKSRKCWDGLHPACKPCNSARYKRKQQKKKDARISAGRARIAEWLSQNRTAVLTYARALPEDQRLANGLDEARWQDERKHAKLDARLHSGHETVAQTHRRRIRYLVTHPAGHEFNKYVPLMGCAPSFLRGWIEAQFSDDSMTWDTHGEWELDHVVPCAYFNLLEPCNQYRCFHYRNYQPMLLTDNREKATSLTPQAEKLLPFLAGLFPDVPLVKRSDEQERIRREKISATLSAYNATRHGKDKKAEAQRRRSETMKERHYTPTSKTCRRCSQTLPAGEFGKKKAAVDGLQSWCKTCTSEYNRSRRTMG